MLIGERLRELREAKHLSQGDIEKRTGHPPEELTEPAQQPCVFARTPPNDVISGHSLRKIQKLRRFLTLAK